MTPGNEHRGKTGTQRPATSDFAGLDFVPRGYPLGTLDRIHFSQLSCHGFVLIIFESFSLEPTRGIEPRTC